MEPVVSKIETSLLSGPALDWAITKCERDDLAALNIQYPAYAKHYPKISPSTDWALGGPILEREGISVIRCDDDFGQDEDGFCNNVRIPVWAASSTQHSVETSTDHQSHEAMYQVAVADVVYGSTMLEAGMRLFVSLKLGREVAVPEELCAPQDVVEVLPDAPPSSRFEKLFAAALQGLEEYYPQLSRGRLVLQIMPRVANQYVDTGNVQQDYKLTRDAIEREAKKCLPVEAEVHSDDFCTKAEFNAAAWFEQADSNAVMGLIGCGWRGDYEADAVAEFFQDSNTEVARVFQYVATRQGITSTKDCCGFECSVDETSAVAWLAVNRNDVPVIAEYLASRVEVAPRARNKP